MPQGDITKFQLKRVNPFQGLVIDADTWRDAHSYHRDQMRLHLLTFHSVGIVEGLKVTASKPPDLSVIIHPGVAVDPEGNVIIVPQLQQYRLQTRKKGDIYLVLQFREVPSEPYQPPEGGQPTRVLDAFRIQERDRLPAEPHLELARIGFDPADKVITDAVVPSNPGKNEINLCYRREISLLGQPAVIAEKSIPPREQVIIGYVALAGAGPELHSTGLKNLVRVMNQQHNLAVSLEENIPLNKNLSRYTILYMVGNSHFELTADERAALSNFIKSGLVFGEGCSEGQGEARAFGLAFNQLATQLNRRLEIVQRGHPLLSVVHVFSEVPQGAEPAMLLEGGNMIYSGSDYGCAWQGGHRDSALPRDVIRSSLEIGINIVAYARMIGAGH